MVKSLRKSEKLVKALFCVDWTLNSVESTHFGGLCVNLEFLKYKFQINFFYFNL